ncbi:Bacterial regulatory protein, tetR family [Mycobacteroides franklinii]|uniref:Bacterial regulatory protein, tetR family n=1 Tax=Mycobacteroides franklinii TaxID=948102 RepID=A0A4R8QTH0_9MYCO|nr:Bacterial regulatory protein, tetR family [Mycobacteroides franklinii]TDZ47301.1 Bacterial regulatory protein, tetR family [Mycobacteroides franklinii]TDZ57967.1 Bacterial regulatory protein, tetR family [Mycobacteroides franklinii]TDZ64909.1 Bacterial regulatory protein, tetR family [Mycobacteroides franklinii]TDZ71307.1 Bacterial regulatory protein, tetR family [Mycobacteroides franklinii]
MTTAARGTAKRPRRGRRPADEVRDEVLQAAGDLLFDEGISGFTIDRVAALSGASKMTIYKWWPSKGALALDGYFRKVEPELSFPDSGDIERDLRRQMRAFLGIIRESAGGRIIGELIGHAQIDPELKDAFLQRYSGPRRALAVGAIRRAQERDQLSAGADPEVVVDQLWGACYHRLLIPDQPLTEGFVDALLDNLLGGIRV